MLAVGFFLRESPNPGISWNVLVIVWTMAVIGG